MKKVNHHLNILADKELKDSFSIVHLNGRYFGEHTVCRITYNRIFLIEKGEGSILVDEVVYPVADSELFLLSKGQLYTFLPGTTLTGYELCFGDCFWEKSPASASNCKAVLFNNAVANQQVPLNGDNLTELAALFRVLLQEFSATYYINKLDALAAYLKIIMIKTANVNAALAAGYDTFENQLYRQFVELVSKQYQTTHEVAWFAKQLNISTRKLTDLCNSCSGKGAKEIINGQLISEAKRSLQFSSKPVKEIAYQLSFSTPEQFSHFFKKNTQVSPNQYRENFVHIGM